MKMMAGDFFLAAAKSSRMRFAPTPTNLAPLFHQLQDGETDASRGEDAHLFKFAARGEEEGHACLACHGACEHRLARAAQES